MNFNSFEIDLIATYEELHFTTEKNRVVEYIGDYSMHVLKDGISQQAFEKRLAEALDEIGLTREQYNAIAEQERFVYRINIIDYFKKHSKRHLK